MARYRCIDKLFRRLAALVMGLALAACATVAPVQEMSDARQAIRAAKQAGGERYTPEVLIEAEALVARASESLAEGNYREARRAALSAKQRAIMARRTALALQEAEP